MKGIQNNLSIYQQTIVSELSAIRNDINNQSQHFDKKFVEQSTDFDRRMIQAEASVRERFEDARKRFDQIEAEYVPHTTFKPVAQSVYGAIALILTVVIGSIITFFVRSGGLPTSP